ncbi:MAG TPA: PAS domain S-box protein [Candidatus Binatia bacterium]|nr:PAS domain S-box protein [Candidatus Binatia bacterium]
MSSADRTRHSSASAGFLRTRLRFYAFALIAVCAASALQQALEAAIAFPHSFLLFYPTILIVALLAGFWPGVVATALCELTAAYFYMHPADTSTVSDETRPVGLVLFGLIGMAISWLASSSRQRANRLQEFESVVESLEEMIAVIDRNYRYRIANPAFLRYRGMKKEDLIGRHVSDVLDPTVFENQIKPNLDRCFQGEIVSFEMTYQYPELGKRQLLIEYLPIQGSGGIDRVACLLRDLTDQKKSDQALQLFRRLIDESNDAVEVVDPLTLRFLDMNDKTCRDLGYKREELLGMTVFDIDPNVGPSSEVALREKVRAEGSIVKESIHRRKDGSTFPVEVSITYVELERNYLVTVARDITERKRAEDVLRESEDRYRDLVEHSEDLVCTHDLRGHLLSVNPAARRLLGYEIDELLMTSMRDFIAPEFRPQFDQYLEKIQAKGADSGCLCVLTKDGRRRIWEYRNTLRSEGVPFPVVRGMAHDVTERKQVQDALRLSEQRMRLFIEHAPAGAALLDREMRYIQASRRWRTDYGLGDRDIIGVSHHELFPELPERWKEAHRRCLAGEILREECDRFERADGRVQWVRWELFPWYEKEQIEGIAIFAEDVTAKELARQALRVSEQRYRTLFEKAIAAVGIITLGGKVIDCNNAWARMFGHSSAAECRDRQIQNYYRDPAERDPLLEELREKGLFANRELLLCRKDGTPFWVLLNSVLLEAGQEEPLIQSTMFEITERKQAEDSLRRREEHFRILVEQASDGIFIANQHGNYVDVNSAGAEMLGYTREEILQLSISDVVTSEERHRIAGETAQVAAGQSLRNEWKFERKDGSVFPGEVSARCLPDGRLQGILRDITERKRTEEILRQSEERFRVALNDSPITVFNQDCDLRYTWLYNPQLHWQHDVLGKTDDEVVGPKRAAILNHLKRRVLDSGVGLREEVAIPNNGTSHVFDIAIEPLFDGQRKVVGITAACMDIARLRAMADHLQESRDRLAEEKSYLESEIQTELGFQDIVGQSPALREVLKKARVVAPTDSTVLLLGETGTGKELVARSIHALSGRSANTFVKLNCAAVPSGLLESELFGHEKGAFTGAVNQKIGRIELADKGTLFLDEIGEMPPDLQPKLLRVLQDREFERLGGIKTLHVDVRIISATNRDLRQDIADRKFREDLFYRLNVFPIELPPLRERRDDIEILVQHFVSKYSLRMRKHVDTIPDEAMRILRSWNWPGNIRELENMVERMVIMSKGSVLAAPPAEISEAEYAAVDNLTDMEREHILRVLRETNGIVSGSGGAASRLGLKRTTLQSMIRRLGIQPHEYRNDGATGTFAR